MSGPVIICHDLPSMAMHSLTLLLPPQSGSVDHAKPCQVFPSLVRHSPTLRGASRSFPVPTCPVYRCLDPACLVPYCSALSDTAWPWVGPGNWFANSTEGARGRHRPVVLRIGTRSAPGICGTLIETKCLSRPNPALILPATAIPYPNWLCLSLFCQVHAQY